MKEFNLTTIIFYMICLQTFWNLSFSVSHIDTITRHQSITDLGKNSTTLVSSDGIFESGFFSPQNSEKRFFGIWFKATPHIVVWIANRNKPLNKDSNAKLTISEKGNLVLLNINQSSNQIVWSSESLRVLKHPVAKLLSSGNLVLVEQSDVHGNSEFAWQSFDYPTDTFLAGMRLGWDSKTGIERFLISSKSVEDLSTGNTTYRLNLTMIPQMVLADGSSRKYRSGLWNGVQFNGFKSAPGSAFELENFFNENEAYVTFSRVQNSMISILRLNESRLERLTLSYNSSEWKTMYTIPSDSIPCAEYGYCGTNSVCNLAEGFASCECLEGFEPASNDEWIALNWSSGCKRKRRVFCGEGEGFVKVLDVKLPDLLDCWLEKKMRLEECEEACLKNCSCLAYANSDVRRGGSGCLMWFGDLIDMKKIYVKGEEQDFYVRLSASEMKSIRDANRKERMKLFLLTLLPGMFVFGVVILWATWKLKQRIKGKNKLEGIELPIFDLGTIVTATSNFAKGNMIGEGGFGLVYKGNLRTGQEIAVKRLSENSGQGSKEFKNEAELIAKLQHRNLVALLGCCVEGHERMLIYEYMPNKSLDHFIFESKRSIILPWEKVFNIVKGIARGLLYLHQDSNLQIVHRDLKASNILLDNKLNPKISDFGLARILRDDEKQAKTRKVMGTYGYMSPEYAIDGNFSLKSDVFSFGVLLLEIVSAKKNRNFSHPNHQHNLLGHAWLLMKQGRATDLMDKCFKDSCVESQVVKCIQVGLLCVQKSPRNRPTMSNVVFMLENEGTILPQPKEQPGYFAERCSISSSDDLSTSKTQDSHSQNEVSITILVGR